MADQTPVGDGAPPQAAPPAAPTAPAETASGGDLGGNVSIAEYARRKAEQAKATKAKPVKRQTEAVVQKQPDAAPAGSEKSEVLSQEAEGESGEADAVSEAEAPEAAEETATEEPADDSDIPEDAPEWVPKRIARFTRQKVELEKRLAEADGERQQLRGEVERLKSSGAGDPPLPVVVDHNDPASGITNETQLEQTYNQARWLKRWCERNPDGGTLEVANGKGGIDAREFSAEQVRSMREAAEDDIEQHLPRRREYLRTERSMAQEAIKEHPWLTDKASPRLERFKQVIAAYPPLRLRPDWVRAAAVFVRGLEAVEAEAKAGTAPATAKPKTPPPKVIGAPRSAPPRSTPGTALKGQLATAEKEWRENPNQRTFARLQELKRQQRTE
jgi:hypothetical protein